MQETFTFETEAWICDCNKTWPEEVEICTCGVSQEVIVQKYPYETNRDKFPHEEFTVAFPARWEVCGCCRGTGTTTFGYSSRDQIAWTQSEWAEEDPEFREDYMNGYYDKSCPECGGRTTVKVIDERCFNKDQEKWYQAYCKYMEAGYHCDMIAEAERRFGC